MPAKVGPANTAKVSFKGFFVNDALLKGHDDCLQGLVDTGQLDQAKADARKLGPLLTTWQYAGTIERVQLRLPAINANGLAGYSFFVAPSSAVPNILVTLGGDKTGTVKINGAPKDLNEAAMMLRTQLEAPAKQSATEYVVFTINSWAYSLNQAEIDKLNTADTIDYLGDASGGAGGRYYVATKDKARELQSRIGSGNIQTYKITATKPDGSPMPTTTWAEAKTAGKEQYKIMSAPPKPPAPRQQPRTASAPSRPAPSRNLPWWHHTRRNGRVKRAVP